MQEVIKNHHRRSLIEILVQSFAISLIVFGFSTSVAFGHGLGGEVLPPVTIEDRDATLSIDVSPSIYDPENPEHFVTLRLFDSNTEAIIEHVTLVLEMKKDGKSNFQTYIS